MKYLLLLGTLLLLSSPVLAQESKDSSKQVVLLKRTLITKKITNTTPVIDGKLDDPAWEAVAWGENFRQLEPTDGGEAVAPTAFKILYDDAYLYAAFRCYDPEPDKIVERMSRRDGFEGDWIELNLDSYNGRLCHNYYVYQDQEGIFQTIPWDMNLNFGGFRFVDEKTLLDVKKMQELSPMSNFKNPKRPLISKLLANSMYRKIYIAHVRTILKENFSQNLNKLSIRIY